MYRSRVWLLIGMLCALPAQAADELGKLKRQVVDLNAELEQLEQSIFFPPSTRYKLFLSMDVGDFFQLGSVQVKVDDVLVVSHLYVEDEADALLRGGIQQLHMGNLRPGKHKLVIVSNGLGPRDRKYRIGTEYWFEKKAGEVILELKIRDSEAKQQPEMVVKSW